MVRSAWEVGSRGWNVALALPPAVAFAQYPPAEPCILKTKPPIQ